MLQLQCKFLTSVKGMETFFSWYVTKFCPRIVLVVPGLGYSLHATCCEQAGGDGRIKAVRGFDTHWDVLGLARAFEQAIKVLMQMFQ